MSEPLHTRVTDRLRCLIGVPRFITVDPAHSGALIQVCAGCRRLRGGRTHA